MDIYMGTQQKKFVFFLILAVIVGMLVGLSVTSEQQQLQKISIGKAMVRVEVAETAQERNTGLSGREALRENEGMVFMFEQPGQYGFWMKGMRFPLDFVWIADSEVVEITEDVPVSNEDSPKVYQPQQPIEAMVEVNAGWVKRNGVRVGDEVVVE